MYSKELLEAKGVLDGLCLPFEHCLDHRPVDVDLVAHRHRRRAGQLADKVPTSDGGVAQESRLQAPFINFLSGSREPSRQITIPKPAYYFGSGEPVRIFAAQLWIPALQSQ